MVSLLVVLSSPRGGSDVFLVMSEAQFLVKMVNTFILQLTLAWISTLTSLHAVIILIITVAIQINDALQCIQIEIDTSEVLSLIALPVLLLLPLCLLEGPYLSGHLPQKQD